MHRSVKRNLLRRLAVLFMSTALLTGACGSAAMASSEKNDTLVVRISNFSGTSVPYNLGIDTGIFDEVMDEEGFNVEFEIINFTAGAEAVEAAQAGELDIITCGDQMLTTAILENGLPFKVIATNYTNSDYQFLATQQSGIQSPEDVKGTKVGVRIGTNLYLGVLAFLEDNGISTDDVEFVNLSAADSVTAFFTGEIDWGLFNGSNRDRLLEEADPVFLGTNGDYKMNECVIGVSDEFAEEHHDLVVALLKAFNQATEYALENPEAALESAMNNYDNDEETLRASMEECDFITALTPEILDSIQRTLDYSYTSGLISEKATVDQVIDLSYLEEAGIQ